ncbi:MAG TPA: sigma-70 family RNA polymerase sigma factor [Gaiellaceae bacterium]|nr:sigma-70 family RNA polymerase sigma factor [Gaiellaceae bacterium]
MTELPSHLLGRSRRREATAVTIEAAYRAHASEFLRVATAIAGSREGGRDAVQEALTRAFARRGTFRGSGTVEAWLWKAVVNAARNVRARSPVVAQDSDVEARADDACDDRREAVRAAVAALPERQRHALFLRYYADLDYAAIAAALGVRRGTVSATLSHAHAALRAALGEEVLA